MNLIEMTYLNKNKIVAHLLQHLQESRAELFSVYLQFLVERMPRIYEAVIAAKEGNFDDSKF